MPNYRRVRHGSTFFFTLVTRDRLPILCEPPVREHLRTVLRELRTQRPFTIDAWVLLPDHMHCLWTLPDSDPDYSARWGWLKKEVTQRLRDIPALTPVIGRTLWQKRFWEHAIRNDMDFAAHCDYIHSNPVKHGLVKQVSDWPWSTFHRFVAKDIYPATGCIDEMTVPDNVGRE